MHTSKKKLIVITPSPTFYFSKINGFYFKKKINQLFYLYDQDLQYISHSKNKITICINIEDASYFLLQMGMHSSEKKSFKKLENTLKH